MKASPWEKEDAIHEGIPILDCLVPKAFLHENGKLTGMSFDKVRAVRDDKGRRQLVSTGEPEQVFECDDVLVAVGQENAFPWIERDAGIAFDEWGMPVLDAITLQSSLPRVFFGGDAALGPKNIIWAVAQGHAAAISIDKFLHGEDVTQRPAPGVTLVSQKMGIHEWSYDNDITPDLRHKVPWRDINQSLRNIKVEVELGFDVADGLEGSASAASTATCRRCSRPASASSATPASTSARPTASPSPPTATRPTCARACARRRATPTRRSTSPTT